MQDLLDHLQLDMEISRHTSRRMEDYYTVISGRLRALLNTCGKIFDCSEGYPIEKLLELPLIIELNGLGDYEHDFLVLMFLSWIYHYRLENGWTNIHIIGIDDCHRVFSSTKEKQYALGFPLVNKILDEIRSLGEGILASDQYPTQVVHALIANSYCKIVGALGSGEDVRKIASCMASDPEEIAEIGQVIQSLSDKGFWVVKISDRYTKPFTCLLYTYPRPRD